MANQHEKKLKRERGYTSPLSPSLHSSGREGTRDRRRASTSPPPVPRHPVPSMQAAFEESIRDLQIEERNSEAGNSSSRSRKRQQRNRGCEHHRLLKVVSQIAFGIHLLHGRLAKSDSEVVRILQSHVNDMDEFISKTTRDFDLAKSDISQRLKHLRVPLDSEPALVAFDGMLESREFRLQILEGNENVEYVIERTIAAMKKALKDVAEGLAAVDDLAKYLLGLKEEWKNSNLVRVYSAMTFNVEQWFRGLVALQMKSVGLKEELVQLKGVLGEIERRTGIASRRNRETLAVIPQVTKQKSSSRLDKSLPPTPAPDTLLNAIDIRISNSHKNSKRISRTASQTLKPARSLSQRLLHRHSSLSTSLSTTDASTRTPSSVAEYDSEIEEDKRKSSRVRVRPVPELWPEPLSQSSGSKNEQDDDQEDGDDFVFRPDNEEKKDKNFVFRPGKEERKSMGKGKEKAGKMGKSDTVELFSRPDSCAIM
ncbi:hypothetical protein L873DRAFT_1830576 [Choiromyces venosus 120613-1]|uniref:Uncharacterized protein n=1 Tax=Choiromyces venosus 120613-1 TaxID=1336337 RepID=A0A3N4J663_9PEZI|nr:hypothetical protein L873DRAFT_1830576 [Choiromyces venosus 120613-1]